jgi:sporulation protein YlmC with PRC-barrel domain
MTDLKSRTLVKLGDTDLKLSSKDEDIRGRSVIDSAGEKIGEVKELMIDDTESRVRFLQVGSGGVLGIGDKHFLIPVDSVKRVDEDNVYLSETSSRIQGAPAYDPTLVVDDNLYSDLYAYYGYSPYWSAGYAYPAFPHYRV